VIGIGGLGHLAVQYARALGLPTVAVTSRADKQAEARQMGADEVVRAGDDPGLALQALGGVDVILSTTDSAQQVSQALRGLRPQGRLVSVGVPNQPVMLNLGPLIMAQPRLIVATQGERRDLVDALRLCATGKVKPLLELYPLEQINHALERLMAGKVRYRAVLQHRA
jgi:D-arabinose 1-dehydrogenase-like Zn-dependent alcohol dehydrogenase